MSASTKSSANIKAPTFTPELASRSDLTLAEKMVLALVTANEGLPMSNEEMGAAVNITAGTVAKILTGLRKLGLINTASFDGRKRVLTTQSKEESLYRTVNPDFTQTEEAKAAFTVESSLPRACAYAVCNYNNYYNIINYIISKNQVFFQFSFSNLTTKIEMKDPENPETEIVIADVDQPFATTAPRRSTLCPKQVPPTGTVTSGKEKNSKPRLAPTQEADNEKKKPKAKKKRFVDTEVYDYSDGKGGSFEEWERFTYLEDKEAGKVKKPKKKKESKAPKEETMRDRILRLAFRGTALADEGYQLGCGEPPVAFEDMWNKFYNVVSPAPFIFNSREYGALKTLQRAIYDHTDAILAGADATPFPFENPDAPTEVEMTIRETDMEYRFFRFLHRKYGEFCEYYEEKEYGNHGEYYNAKKPDLDFEIKNLRPSILVANLNKILNLFIKYLAR